jgi:hypothetical protein
MERRGFKGTGIRDEYGNPVYGKPLTYGELRAKQSPQLYDTSSGTVRDIKSVQDSDELVPVQLNRVVNFDGADYSIILRKKEDVSPLPQNVIPRRTGYVNLAYDDVGALVKLSFPRTVNGAVDAKGGQEVLRFARSTKEAQKFLDSKPKGSDKTNRELLLQGAPEGAEVIVSESRETLFDLASVDVKSDGVTLPYNLRGRKDQPIESVRGTLEIKEMEQRIASSLNGMERALNRDGVDTIKRRFTSQFGQYLRNPTQFPESKNLRSEFRVNETGIVADAQTRANMENIHAYVLDMERTLGYRKDSEFQLGMNEVLDSVGVGRTDVIQKVKTFASTIAIYGRPAFQALANTSQALHLIQLDPVRGSASIVEAALSAPAIAWRKAGKNVDWNLYAKMTGFKSGEDLTKFIDSIETAGVFSAAQVDNLLSNFDSARRVSSRSGLGNLSGAAVRLPKTIQALGTDLSNLTAYRHAYKLSGGDLKKSQELFRDLTLRMDKSDVLATETDPLSSLFFLWTQHVYKGWKNRCYSKS